MRKVKREYKVYSFDELSDGAKDKAIEQFSDINVDLDYWMYDDTFYYFGNDIGIKVDMKEISFDLDRGSYVYFSKNGIHIESPEKLIKAIVKAGIIDKKYTKHLMEYSDIIFDIGANHYGGGSGRNYLDINDEGGKLPDDTEDKLHAWFEREFEQKLLRELRDEYNYRTSREAIIESIIANEYEFLENGKFFIL